MFIHRISPSSSFSANCKEYIRIIKSASNIRSLELFTCSNQHSTIISPYSTIISPYSTIMSPYSTIISPYSAISNVNLFNPHNLSVETDYEKVGHQKIPEIKLKSLDLDEDGKFLNLVMTARHHVDSSLKYVYSDDAMTVLDDSNNDDSSVDANISTRFDALWLRHNCHCSRCKQDFSGQKVIMSDEVSLGVTVLSFDDSDDGELAVMWSDDHRGHLPLHHLYSYHYSNSAIALRSRDRHPPPCLKLRYVRYSDLVMNNVDADHHRHPLSELLLILYKYGAVIVRDAPHVDGTCGDVAQLIAPVQRTIYGEYSDVRAVDRPINVAYSNSAIPLHTDLVYYESPPGLQLLHCLRRDHSVTGGATCFLDAFAAAQDFRFRCPEEFDVLRRIPATFQKIHYARQRPVHMIYQRPHISTNQHGDIVAVFWAPPFEGALQVESSDDVKDYYRAHAAFTKHLHDLSSPHLLLSHILRAGDVAVFNNRRILHSREAFTLNGGERHLQVCYVNIDEFESSAKVAMSSPSSDWRVSNQNML